MIFKQRLLSSLFIIAGLVGYGANALAIDSSELSPTEVYSPIQRVFVPLGFDSNDVTEVVLKGEFANSCYKVSSVEAKVDEQKREITIISKALSYKSALCATVMVPFIQPVKIGVVKAGDYKIIVNPDSEDTKFSQVEVKEAINSAPDDFLYASASSVNLVTDLDANTQEVVLNGYYPLAYIGCFRISDVETNFSGGVLVVQPKMEEYPDESERCMEPNNFEYRINLNTFVEDALMHVRVLNGESINSYIPILR